VEPLTILRRAGVRRVQLIVRLCYATMPDALEAAAGLPGVAIRYFASDIFHAKFYILGDNALLGSANLTRTGLQTNHEIAVTLHDSDQVFSELRAYFSSLWGEAREATRPAFERFVQWHERHSGTAPDDYSEGETLAEAEEPAEPNGPAMTTIEPPQRLFPGMNLVDAAMEQLNRMGAPQQAKAIHQALQKDGFEMRPSKQHRKPYKPVYDALLKRESGVGDVFRTGPGLWTLAKWYTAEEADRLKQLHVKARAEHIELTRRGMREAKERGRKLGAPPIMTEANRARVSQMLRDGMRVEEIAKFFGVSDNTIYTYFPGGRTALREQLGEIGSFARPRNLTEPEQP
jgi:PLD-like domain/Homeodomain-like domain